MLCELSINLIDLPLTHPKLIDWEQQSILHTDEFPTKEVLLRFMGVDTPHKKWKPPSAYVYKLDPKGYFREEENYSHKNERKK